MIKQTHFPFRNPHINTIFANNGPRKWLVRQQVKAFEAASEDVILDCGEGIRLHGLYTFGGQAETGLVVLLHGWEGTAHSIYLASAAHALHQAGYSVFRLHMRDHGPSHHLNREPFLAVRLDEILGALEQVTALYPHRFAVLVGFSLGANIAVRVAANIADRPIHLDKVVAISPPVDPEAAASAIQRYPIYNRYFVYKWQRSFRQKMAYFDSYKEHIGLLEHTDILAMHEEFVPLFSDYNNASSYFAAYALNDRNLARMDVPCHIILAKDDPIIPAWTGNKLPDLAELSVAYSENGGHCGFVQDVRLGSALDSHLLALLAEGFMPFEIGS